jgi:coenzyme F420-reducing hydrogenase beta subunit
MEKSAIYKIGIKNCTGCYACFNVCEHEAVIMKMTVDGFYKPNIIEEKCVDCGLCVLKCPVINPEYLNETDPKFFMAWSKNSEIRKTSSSGGIFSEIAESVFVEGGEVYGATWDENLEVKHIKATSSEKIGPLRGSKYLQSMVNKSYKTIKDTFEKTAKKILFVGTPCQVAGIKKIVKDDRLLTCDLLCHGIPSYIPFKSYLASMEDKIKKVNFRDKCTGWTNFSISLFGEKGKYSKLYTKDKFYMGFLKDYYLNEACYDCQFNRLPRQGDITLGDFWGIDNKYDKNNLGVSVVSANNKKGYDVLTSLERDQKIELEKVDKVLAWKSNPRIYSGELLRPEKRNHIINDIKKLGFTSVAEKEIRIPSDLERKVKGSIPPFIKKGIKKLRII